MNPLIFSCYFTNIYMMMDGSIFPQWVFFDGRSQERDENLERRNLVNCEGVKKLVKVLEEGETCF